MGCLIPTPPDYTTHLLCLRLAFTEEEPVDLISGCYFVAGAKQKRDTGYPHSLCHDESKTVSVT